MASSRKPAARRAVTQKPVTRKAAAKKKPARPAAKPAAASKAPKAKQAPVLHPLPAVHVSFDALAGLLGKGVGDPAVKAVLATAGHVRQTPTHIVAREAGFELSLGRSPDERVDTRPLVALHLFAGHGKQHRTFASLPPPFIFSDRASVIGVTPRPIRGFPRMSGRKQGLVPLDVDVRSDVWKLGKREIAAHYRDGFVRSYTVI
ncbi:MAG TPA: hypothetical protein VNO30_24375 [Kofleriaceae bacterium]|nr:hypothetical protein [Kofleriaceae bacterium]